jgi:tetrahydromethanopterin S-methyltransferase subunit D
MTVEKALNRFGIFLIVVGIFIGIFGWFGVDYETYSEAKKWADKVYADEEDEAIYQAAKTIWLSEVSNVIGGALGGIIFGLILMGLSKMLTIQQSISDNLYKGINYYKKAE